MNVFRKMALVASVVMALAFVAIASAATIQQTLVFTQHDSVYAASLPVTITNVVVNVDDADSSQTKGSSQVTFSTDTAGVCEVQAGSLVQAIPGNALTISATLDLIGYGDCVVTARRAQTTIGPDTYPARSITQSFKVARNEPITTNELFTSLVGSSVLIEVEGKYHQTCNATEGFVLRAFPVKGVLSSFSNIVCINDGAGGSIFHGQLTYTPWPGTVGLDSFKYSAISHGQEDSTPATVSGNIVPPVTVPGAPVILSVISNNGNAFIIFQAPASDGNSPLIEYSIIAVGSHGIRGVIITAGESAGKIEGLADGEVYVVYATARNAVGVGPKSNEVLVVIDNQPDTSKYELGFQWSLVSWSGASNIPVQDALTGTGLNEAGNDISGGVTAVYGWSGASQQWLAFFPQGVNLPGANTLTTLIKGQPYWVAVKFSMTWTVQVD